MSISWDLGGGDTTTVEFTKFPVGTTRIRVLDPAPHIRWHHWLNQFGRSINCPGMRVCPIDDIIDKQRANREEPTYDRGRRYSLNIFNYETNRVEIMEQGKTFLEDLKLVMQDLADEGLKLSDVKLRVRRTGLGKDDTKYRIDIDESVKDEPIPEGVTDLKEYFKPATVEQITALLNVTENHQEAFAEIMYSEDAESDTPDEPAQDEEVVLE